MHWSCKARKWKMIDKGILFITTPALHTSNIAKIALVPS